MEKKYAIVAFTYRNHKIKKVGKTYKSYDEAIDAVVNDIAKSNKQSVEEWEAATGGREEVLMYGGEYDCIIANGDTKQWKVIEV